MPPQKEKESLCQKNRKWAAPTRHYTCTRKSYLNSLALLSRPIAVPHTNGSPPEQINKDADAHLATSPLRPPEVVTKILAYADRAKSEPNSKVPRWVAEVILNEPLMNEIAPSCELKKWFEIRTAAAIPRAD